MPYLATQPLIVSIQDERGARHSYHEYLPQNGTRLRRSDGYLITANHTSTNPVLFYVSVSPEEKLSGVICDQLLVARIDEYLRLYYGRRYTNCSAFAHFLFTGKFIECENEHNLAVVHHHMQHYRNVRQVNVGDMVCLIYVRQRLGQSRKTEWRRHFLTVKKSRRDKGASINRSLRTPKTVLTPGEILEYCKNPLMVDYHFMVCVDKKNGLPVWLSQNGRDDLSDEPPSFAITLGDEDPLPKETLLLSLIKRRR
jgi:hypothetical protein